MTDPLPEGSLLLHVGPPKTGSTAIQRAMHESRAELARHGVLYPGTSLRDREASWAVLGTKPAVGRPPARIKRWQALVDEIRRTELPRACLSHENFARAGDAGIERILDDLGRDRVHLVFVARRLDKLLPSQWQEDVKAWNTKPYDEYLHRMLDGQPEAGTRGTLWVSHDIEEVVGRWVRHLSPDQVTVIASDEQDHGLIPRTFEALLGLPDGMLAPPPARSNTSLGYTETEALRALNLTSSEDGWTSRQYWQVVQNGIVPALAALPDDGPRLSGLPPWAFDRVAALADRQIAQIAGSGVRVIGDPERLRVRDVARPADLPPPVEAVPLDLLAAMVQGAVDGSAALHRRTMKAELRTVRRQRKAAGPAADTLGGRALLRQLARRAARRAGVSGR